RRRLLEAGAFARLRIRSGGRAPAQGPGRVTEQLVGDVAGPAVELHATGIPGCMLAVVQANVPCRATGAGEGDGGILVHRRVDQAGHAAEVQIGGGIDGAAIRDRGASDEAETDAAAAEASGCAAVRK